MSTAVIIRLILTVVLLYFIFLENKYAITLAFTLTFINAELVALVDTLKERLP
jgi:hypothetical protein